MRRSIQLERQPERSLPAHANALDADCARRQAPALLEIRDDLREQVALKKNLESRGEMSAGLAHEFKNAMAALHGYAQFLQSVDRDQQGQVAADALLHEVRNLSEMTTAFLNFARPQPLQLEEVSLDELVDECARELKPLFESRRVELVSTASGSDRVTGARASLPAMNAQHESSSIEVRADPRLLRQALLNLLRNAAEAIPESNHCTA